MNYADARQIVVASLHKAANVLNDPRWSAKLTDPQGDVAIAGLELDSLDIVEWCMEIETRTGVEIDLADPAAFATIAEFARFLAERVGQRPE